MLSRSRSRVKSTQSRPRRPSPSALPAVYAGGPAGVSADAGRLVTSRFCSGLDATRRPRAFDAASARNQLEVLRADRRLRRERAGRRARIACAASSYFLSMPDHQPIRRWAGIRFQECDREDDPSERLEGVHRRRRRGRDSLPRVRRAGVRRRVVRRRRSQSRRLETWLADFRRLAKGRNPLLPGEESRWRRWLHLFRR
jgi:hypothetical protein